MSSRGQVVGIVIIASSLVTWIGVHQLGYAEFGEIQRTLRYGVGNQRRAMGNNVYLASLAQRLAEARDAQQLHSTLSEAMSRLQFERVEVAFEKGAVAPAVAAAFPCWDLETTDARMHPTSTWRVPLVSNGKLVATVVLTRSLGEPAQFDPGHLLIAIRNGFGSRLLAFAETSPSVEVRSTGAAVVNS